LEIQKQVGINPVMDQLTGLTTKYIGNHDLIDFKEIRKTLRNFSSINLPPAVFTRSADQEVQTTKIKPDNSNAQQGTAVGAGINASLPDYRVEEKAKYDDRSSENNKNGLIGEESYLDDMLEIEGVLIYGNTDFEAMKNKVIVVAEGKADALMNPSIEKATELDVNEWISGKEYWLTFYDNKLKMETFVQDGTTKIERDDECKITNENVEAFCEILIWVNKNEKMPVAIVGGDVKANALVYEELCKHNQGFAEKVKPMLGGIF
jgi:hypothetical protein